ncbi:prolycopene isomerase, chloroplastic-like [Tripterygium wilfordii]|uniref:prolycopene isomerase, chloroplastic-like n=1 Tax=Tripterygium wilfordii TaxID=458696 RepID=UPI0018F83947|nr:prolycopene isomerase, chloroplastic-like [Tripterygium wilfordii]
MELGFRNTLTGNIGNNFLSGARIGGRSQTHHDAIVIGVGIGGLVAATQLAVKGARVLVLEKYVIPGGSYGFYQREGYTFDVGHLSCLVSAISLLSSPKCWRESLQVYKRS